MTTIPTTIVDKNGKTTTVHKKPDESGPPSSRDLAVIAAPHFDEYVEKNDFGFEPDIIEAFTNGDCWALAIELSRQSGYPVVTMSTEDDRGEWCHVGVELPNENVLDARGEYEVEAWFDEFSMEPEYSEIELWEDADEFEASCALIPRLTEYSTADYAQKVLAARQG
jgi:hypothetical protein